MTYDSFDCFPHTSGPVRIISLCAETHSVILKTTLLEKILLDPRFVDKKVALISVTGAYRKGKSFLLNLFLRYLSWRQNNDPSSEWLTSSKTLDGFSWRAGHGRETNGILLWSEPYVIKDANNEDIVVLLMDTQGTFDSDSTIKENTTIFGLATLLSSLQIYNLMSNIQEDDLQHLQLFVEYGKFALEHSSKTPFQSLLFLVRDWVHDDEYGFNGGQRLLDKRLENKNNQKPELQQLRKQIDESFENVRCFLMPYPGIKVARGQFSDLDRDFEKQLHVLVPSLLNSNALKFKSIDGKPVTCRTLFEYFKTYIDFFQSHKMPEPTSRFQATAIANNLTALSSAKTLYIKEMEKSFSGDVSLLNSENFETEHQRCLQKAEAEFNNVRKIGGYKMSIKYLDDLFQHIEDHRKRFYKLTNYKNSYGTLILDFIHIAGPHVIAAIFAVGKIALDKNAGSGLGEILNKSAIKILDILMNKSIIEQPELFDEFKMYMNVLKNDDISDTNLHSHTTVIANNLAALSNAKSLYFNEMEKGGNLNPKDFEIMHNHCQENAKENFKKMFQCGEENMSKLYLDDLTQYINDNYKRFKEKR